MDELQKVVADPIRDKVNPQEPPSIISISTRVQLLMIPSPIPTVDTSGIVDIMLQRPTAEANKGTSTEQT